MTYGAPSSLWAPSLWEGEGCHPTGRQGVGGEGKVEWGIILQFSLLPLHPPLGLGLGLGRHPSHQSQRERAQLPLGQDRKDDGPVTPGVNQNQCIKVGGQAQTSILERGMPAPQVSRKRTSTTPYSSPAPSQNA